MTVLKIDPSPAEKLTADGCMRTRLDSGLYREIQQFYQQQPAVAEELNPYLSTTEDGVHPVSMTYLTAQMCRRVHESVQPIAEAWVKRKIKPTYVYGIRTYHRGAVLKSHRDRDDTHVVSAILNVAQETRTEWPLFLEAESGQPGPWRQVYLRPGDLFLYEGNRLEHGRLNPFEGTQYANVFVHYSLQ
jgi:prolyl 4-hydroxylase